MELNKMPFTLDSIIKHICTSEIISSVEDSYLSGEFTLIDPPVVLSPVVLSLSCCLPDAFDKRLGFWGHYMYNCKEIGDLTVI
jgi:hypothetical protein